MRSEEDLSAFRNVARQTIELVKLKHGPEVTINVFPAIPVSCAIEFGRIWQPKAHLPMKIFDQNSNRGFIFRHLID